MSVANAEIMKLGVERRERRTPAYVWAEGDAGSFPAGIDCRSALSLIRRRDDQAIGYLPGSGADDVDAILDDDEVDLLGLLPPLHPEWLGDVAFRRTHGCRFAYIVGEMARGITTPDMVINAARHGFMAFHGSAGLPLAAIEEQINTIRSALGEADNWGANLICNLDDPDKEMATARLFLRLGVRRISASAFLKLTPAVVMIAARGLRADESGRAIRHNFVFAKVSRPEVAEAFLSPPPQAMLDALVATGHVTAAEARLAATLPVASDITVEADSGGHTDNRPLTATFPAILQLRDRIARSLENAETVRVGAAGGIGTPSALAAAFQLGAAYVVTGSVNQSAVESGLSAAGREMLRTAGVADVAMAPAADMFEMGIKVQVLKRGSIFAAHANKLYELYRRHGSFDALPLKDREWLEKMVLRMPIEDAWAETRAYHARRNPAKVEKAEANPAYRMALVCRRYLFLCSQWARDGEEGRKADFQIWCGPAMGAFNDWVRGSFLENLENRTVVQIGKNLIEGAATIQRMQQLRSFGMPVSAAAFDYRPRPLR